MHAAIATKTVTVIAKIYSKLKNAGGGGGGEEGKLAASNLTSSFSSSFFSRLDSVVKVYF